MNSALFELPSGIDFTPYSDAATGWGSTIDPDEEDSALRTQQETELDAYRKAGGSSKKKLATAQRYHTIMKMRLEGHSQYSIAQALGITQAAVSRAIAVACVKANEVQADRVEHYRRLQSERLDMVLTKLWPRIEQGDVNAAATLVKIEERRAKLLGLDAPQRIQVGVELDTLPDSQLLEISMRLGIGRVPTMPVYTEKDIVPSIGFSSPPVVVVNEAQESQDSGGS